MFYESDTVELKERYTQTETFKNNIYITPSGIFDYPQLNCCIDVLSTDRMIHSVDFPFIGNKNAKEYIEKTPITNENKELISYKNAIKLFYNK